ncbi:hypothetical protein WJX81_003269 [Elliptochloris bilobata]|uniref:PHD-type domain-containing protein n=1 Tax=Elliptochloris bilobata TaxID=381761 RepID=A0AAW1SJT8_9CHLO
MPDQSAFWLLSEGYFRDVAREDLADLAGTYADPLDDPILAVPPAGSPHGEQERAAQASAAGGGPAWLRPLAHERVAELRAQAGVDATPPTAPSVGVELPRAALAPEPAAAPATGGAAEQAEPPRVEPRGPTAVAVAAAIDQGRPEGDVGAEWAMLGNASDVLAVAPGDEVLGEILALQFELAQQVAVNRARLAAVMRAAVSDAPARRRAAEARAADDDFAREFLARQDAARKAAARDRREAQARGATAGGDCQAPSPRIGAGRPRGERAHSPSTGPSPPAPVGLADRYADRGEDEEALCAVCGGGYSADPNLIVFCERCDLAVHQGCYGVEQLPAGEWLCWPCRRHEEAHRRAGVPQSKIRPPRWETAGEGGGRALPAGGSRSARCILCPVRHGAFRETVDTREWVHEVCALWTPDIAVRPGAGCAVVEGARSLRPERWGGTCALCGLSEGVVLRCNAGHCAAAAHALCARNAGHYLAVRGGECGQRANYRVYCPVHSDAQRRKDADAVEAGGAPKASPVRRPDARRRERPQAVDRARLAALQALQAREAERDALSGCRLELEALRLLLERLGRRENLKRKAARALEELLQRRAADPAAAIAGQARSSDAPKLVLKAGKAGGSVRKLSGGGSGDGDAEVAGEGQRAKRQRLRGATADALPALKVERQCLMTEDEAKASNKVLPKEYRYHVLPRNR